jgi:hypothetical protein
MLLLTGTPRELHEPRPCEVPQTLSHLSFAISQFNGVTTTAQGFERFYLALDTLFES